jgi:hypothetical protein
LASFLLLAATCIVLTSLESWKSFASAFLGLSYAIVIMALVSSPSSSSLSSRFHTKSVARTSGIESHLKGHRSDPGPSIDRSELLSYGNDDIWTTLDSIDVLRLSLDFELEETPQRDAPEDDKADHMQPEQLVKKPFDKWIKTLHRRAQHQQRSAGLAMQTQRTSRSNESNAASRHRKSSSGSSFGYVDDVKSASISLASESVVERHHKRGARSCISSTADQASRNSVAIARCSEESTSARLDPAALERLLQRRRILEELISTEESYITDIKFLTNVRKITEFDQHSHSRS